MRLDERSSPRFDLNKFKKIDDESDRMQYALSALQQLGEGGSRTVFRLTPKYVLKIASSERGKSQNATESAISEDTNYRRYLARVHSHAPDFSWVISDLVRPLQNEEEFENLFGMPFQEFRMAIEGRNYWKWEGNPKWKVSGSNSPHRDETVGTYGDIQNLRQLVKSKKLHGPELQFIEHWGKTPDGRIVILDYGVDEKNWKNQVLFSDVEHAAESIQRHFIESQGLSYPGSKMHSEPNVDIFSNGYFEDIVEHVREFVNEVVKKCGDQWCLYTKKKINGKRRRLGTHKSKQDAYRQEYAIQKNKK